MRVQKPLPDGALKIIARGKKEMLKALDSLNPAPYLKCDLYCRKRLNVGAQAFTCSTLPFMNIAHHAM